MSRARVFSVLAVVLVAGCLSGGGRRGTPKPTAAASNAPTLNVVGPWRVTTSAGTEKVVITTTAAVSIASDTVVRTDTVRAVLGASYTWVGTSPRSVQGVLADYRVAVDSSFRMIPAGLRLPRPFSAAANAPLWGMTFTQPPESTACAEPTLSALQGLHDAWVVVPADLRVGAQWVDTVQTLSCRDRVPLRGTTVRRFFVRRGEVRDGRRVSVIIERSSSGLLSGDGEQFGEKIEVRGESSGEMRYDLDPSTGRFVHAEGKATLTFTLASSRRNQRVRQSSSTTLVW